MDQNSQEHVQQYDAEEMGHLELGMDAENK